MDNPVPMEVDEALPDAEAHKNHQEHLDRIQRELDNVRNIQASTARFEHGNERLPDGDRSTDEQILDGIWKLYRTHMERIGSPRHYPTFQELQNAIVSDGEYFSNSLGVSEQRLGQIVNMHVIAKWILRKTLHVAPLDVNDGREHERRAELEIAARDVLLTAGYDPAHTTDPIRRVQELDLLTGGRRKGKKTRRRKGKKSTRRKGKKSTRRKGKKLGALSK